MYLNDYITGKVYLVVPNPEKDGLGDRTAKRLSSLFLQKPGCATYVEIEGAYCRVFPLTNPQAGFLQKKLAYRTVRFSLGC